MTTRRRTRRRPDLAGARRLVLRYAACAALAGCVAPEPPSGAYVALMREAMVESVRQAEASDDAEPAVRAVGAWRESGAAGGSGATAGPAGAVGGGAGGAAR